MDISQPMDVTRPPARWGLLGARLVVLATFLDLFMQLPVMAPYAVAVGATPLMVGVIVGMYSATNLFGDLLAGPILDRWGRRRPILIGLGATLLAVLLYIPARDPWTLLAARAVHGFGAAVLATGAFTMLGDMARRDRRAQVMGRSGALIAVAAIVGPPVSGILRDRVGFGAVFLTVALVMLATFLAFLRWGREAPEPVPVLREARRPAPSFISLVTRHRLAAAYLGVLAFTVGLGTLVAHLPLALEALGAGGSRSGMTFGTYAVVALLAMLSPIVRFSDERGRRMPMALGLFLMALGLMTVGLASSVGVIVAGMAAFGLGFGLLFPSATALVVEGAAPAERGTAFGIFYAIYSFGVVIGSWLSGAVAQVQGEVTGLPFLVAAPVALFAAPIVLRLAPGKAR